MVHTPKNKVELEKLLEDAGNKLVVVVFYAPWCGPSKMLRTELPGLEKAYPDLMFVEMNADENESVAIEYEVACFPTTCLLRDKKSLVVFSSCMKKTLVDYIEKHK